MLFLALPCQACRRAFPPPASLPPWQFQAGEWQARLRRPTLTLLPAKEVSPLNTTSALQGKQAVPSASSPRPGGHLSSHQIPSVAHSFKEVENGAWGFDYITGPDRVHSTYFEACQTNSGLAQKGLALSKWALNAEALTFVLK